MEIGNVSKRQQPDHRTDNNYWRGKKRCLYALLYKLLGHL